MRKTIAQRKEKEFREIQTGKASGKSSKKTPVRKKGHPFLGLLLSSPFAAVAYLTKYVIAGYSFTALVCVGIIGIILFYSFMPVIGRGFPKFARTCTVIFTICLILGLTLFAGTEYFIIRASHGSPGQEAQYMVVLGAKVRDDGPSVSLLDRIHKAHEYLQEHPDVIAIVSGGQGEDENMTEAQCMYDELVALGVDPNRIWTEDKATSTDENMRFSLDLIEAKTGTRPGKLAILSSEYHLLRASLMAKKLGIEFVGVPARTSRLSQLINHGMREVAGIWHFFIFGR